MSAFTERGFTLIELLMTIAIIGILASIVLSSLQDARVSSAEATIKQGLGTVKSRSDVYYNLIGFSYAGFCNDAEVAGVFDNIALSNGGVTPLCNDSATAWAASSPLVATSSEWCVDSVGTAGERFTALQPGETVCPAS